MTIHHTYWTAWINMFAVVCKCGYEFNHPSDNSIMICDGCGHLCYNEHSLWRAFGRDRGVDMCRFLELGGIVY